MSKRLKNIVFSVVALFCGGFLYLVFRSETYVATYFGKADYVAYLRRVLMPYECNFLKFYFPDFLWCFALCSGLQAIYRPTGAGNFACGGVALLLGCLWELLQYVGLVAGTGDILDMLAYLFASIINIRMNWEEKKE